MIEQVAVPGLTRPRYVRGCAGFAGFAPDAAGRARVEAFSREGERLIGRERWREWGTEQVASNFIVANDADPLLLPYTRYLNFWNQRLPDTARFVHFLGTYRYHGRAYRDATTAAARALMG